MSVRKARSILFFLAMVLFMAGGTSRADESEDASNQCSKGHTMQCITLGIEAEREKDQDRALAYYRMACMGHPTPDLRACTPMLALSRSMRVLDKEAEYLEERCEKEGSLVCYYLGKEYYKARVLKRAIKHLEPLCKDGFEPPDQREIGPCFHLARSFHAIKDYRNARTYYQLDCGENIERVHPSCENLRNINLIFALTPERVAPEPILKNTGELLFIILCVLPGVGVLVWFFGRSSGLWFLRWGGPGIFLATCLAWGFFVERPAVRVSDLTLLTLCLTTMAGLTFFSWREPPQPVAQKETPPSS